MREVFKSSSYFFAYSRSNTSDSLRYTAKKSARGLSVLNGSKNSFRAEWRLYFEVQYSVPAFCGHRMRYKRTTLDRAGQPRALAPAFCLEEEPACADVGVKYILQRPSTSATTASIAVSGSSVSPDVLLGFEFEPEA